MTLDGDLQNDPKDIPAMVKALEERGIEILTSGFERIPMDTKVVTPEQQAEWLPNGRSTLWFDAVTGKLRGARDALDHRREALALGRRLDCRRQPEAVRLGREAVGADLAIGLALPGAEALLEEGGFEHGAGVVHEIAAIPKALAQAGIAGS